jgi:hypothetical protein
MLGKTGCERTFEKARYDRSPRAPAQNKPAAQHLTRLALSQPPPATLLYDQCRARIEILQGIAGDRQREITEQSHFSAVTDCKQKEKRISKRTHLTILKCPLLTD